MEDEFDDSDPVWYVKMKIFNTVSSPCGVATAGHCSRYQQSLRVAIPS